MPFLEQLVTRLSLAGGSGARHDSASSRPGHGRSLQAGVPSKAYTKTLSLRTIVLLFMCLQMLAAVLVAVSITYTSARSAVLTIGQNLTQQTALSIYIELVLFFRVPMTVSITSSSMVAQSALSGNAIQYMSHGCAARMSSGAACCACVRARLTEPPVAFTTPSSK